MGNRNLRILLIFLSSMIVISCSNSKVNKTRQKETKNDIEEIKATAGPKVIIYKTKADYFQNVPVALNEERTVVASYPGIKDIYYKGEFAFPTKLNNGFLLDNRGINEHVAFLKFTYEEYSKLEKTPESAELYNSIIDKDPITEMYYCGSKFDYKDLMNELNEVIDSNDLSSFQKLK